MEATFLEALTLVQKGYTFTEIDVNSLQVYQKKIQNKTQIISQNRIKNPKPQIKETATHLKGKDRSFYREREKSDRPTEQCEEERIGTRSKPQISANYFGNGDGSRSRSLSLFFSLNFCSNNNKRLFFEIQTKRSVKIGSSWENGWVTVSSASKFEWAAASFGISTFTKSS